MRAPKDKKRLSARTLDFADGCDFRPRGVVCKDKIHDCAHCGWFPAEEKRRKGKIRQKAEIKQ